MKRRGMQRAMSLLATAAVFAGTTVVFAASGINADVNQDGSANKQDAEALFSYLTVQGNAPGAADVNSDGRINAVDLSLVKHELMFPSQSSNTIKDYGTPPNTEATLYADFRNGTRPSSFIASKGWNNGDPFDCAWYEENTSLDGGYLSLTIDKRRDSSYQENRNYSGAEYRTVSNYSYGYYECSMQAIKNDGVVSSFFTYTGPSENNNPWDEIDIEILGKDTTKVQFNYYRDGQGKHEYMYNLGFDASEGFHTYGFDWQPDHITWYVDGREAYTAWGNMPVTASKIMMNVWPGITTDSGIVSWLNRYNGNTPLTARYQWVTYQESEQQHVDPPGPTIPDYGTPPDTSATLYADFRNGSRPSSFIASKGWNNGDPFDCAWYEENTSLDGGFLSLTIDKRRDSSYQENRNYSGAEYRTVSNYSYGYYECSMQAIKNDGVVSSFFTYTGPSENNNPWDEIDIEILGKDTTKVQFNYYRDGQGKHEYMYNLGFDASQGFHTYGFDWQRDHITWYVDGREAYTMWGDMPVTASKIMMNVWPGVTNDSGIIAWLNRFNGNTPLTARYQWVTYKQK